MSVIPDISSAGRERGVRECRGGKWRENLACMQACGHHMPCWRLISHGWTMDVIPIHIRVVFRAEIAWACMSDIGRVGWFNTS